MKYIWGKFTESGSTRQGKGMGVSSANSGDFDDGSGVRGVQSDEIDPRRYGNSGIVEAVPGELVIPGAAISNV
jgi:hypothetical protein